MKVIIIATFIAACSCARLDSNYLPPASAGGAGGGPGLAAPGFGRPGTNGFNGQQSGYGVGGGSQQSGFGSGSSQGGFSGGSSSGQSSFGSGAQQGGFSSGSSQGGFSQASPQQPPIAILSYENVNNGDGSYRFSYETENGIKAQEQGELKNKGSENAIQSVQGSYSYTAPDGQLITVTYIADENGFQPQGDHLPTPPPIPKEIAESLKVIAAAQAQGGNQGYPSGNNNYNGQSNSGYPSAPSNNGYPSAPANNDYAGAPAQGGFPSAPAQGGFPSAPAQGGRPGNQYVPPSNQRPAGNGGFNPQSGYKY